MGAPTGKSVGSRGRFPSDGQIRRFWEGFLPTTKAVGSGIRFPSDG
jgi:hypothetical protein